MGRFDADETKARARSEARVRLRRYRRYYGECALLLVPFDCLTEEERTDAIAVAAALGARIACDATDEAGGSLVNQVVEPLIAASNELGHQLPGAIDDRDLAAWRVSRSTARDSGDPRAVVFRKVWTYLRGAADSHGP